MDTKQRSPAGPAAGQGRDSSGMSLRTGAGKSPPRLTGDKWELWLENYNKRKEKIETEC